MPEDIQNGKICDTYKPSRKRRVLSQYVDPYIRKKYHKVYICIGYICMQEQKGEIQRERERALIPAINPPFRNEMHPVLYRRIVSHTV